MADARVTIKFEARVIFDRDLRCHVLQFDPGLVHWYVVRAIMQGRYPSRRQLAAGR